MSWHTIISYRGVVLQDPAQVAVARAALHQHFTEAGCNAYQAARAAFDQERPFCVDVGGTVIEDGGPEGNGEWADAWRGAAEVVAKALSLRVNDVSVDLQFEEPPVRTGSFDRSTAKRLFIGVMASKETQEAIAEYQMKWQWSASSRLVAPERLHMTLAFLGNVDKQDEERVRLVLQAVSMKPLLIRLSEPEIFRGGIAVLRGEPNIDLVNLRQWIVQQIAGLGLPVDTQPWTPHVTLARGADGCKPPIDPPSIEMAITQISLVFSRPDRAHSYEIIESWPAA